MDVFLHIFRQSKTMVLFRYFKTAWHNSRARQIVKSEILRDSFALRLMIRPYKLLITILRFLLYRGLPGIFKILLMK